MSAGAASLRTRLYWQFLLLGVVPVLAVLGMTVLLLKPMLEEQAEAHNRELALAVRDQVKLQLETREHTAALLSQSLRQGSFNPEQLQRLMQAMLDGDNFIEALYITDSQGRVAKAALAELSGRFPEDALGLDLSRQPYFAQARQSRGPIWSDTFLSTLTGQVTTVLAVPAGDQTVVVELSLAQLSHALLALAQPSGTGVIVLDRTAKVIAHRDARNALQQENLRHLPIVDLAVAGTASQGRMDIDGNAHFGQAMPVESIGWVVMVTQPVSMVMAPISKLGAAIFAALLVAVGLATLASWRMARRTGGELAQLVDASRAAAFEGKVPPDVQFSNAEFNTLWARLRELFHQLNERDDRTRAAQRDLQAVLDAATEVAIFATDSQGKVTVFNIGAQQMLGYRPDEVLGKLTPLAWHDAAEIRASAQALSATRGAEVMGAEVLFGQAREMGNDVRDWTFKCADGSALEVSLAVTSMRTPQGELSGFVGVAIDITQRRRAAALELARKAAELASQAKSTFLSRMSHELRTPMNAILGYTQLLEDDEEHPPSPAQRDRLALIGQAGWHLVELIDEVLDLSSIESGHLRLSLAPVDVVDALRRASQLVDPLFKRLGVSLVSEAGEPGSSAHVWADPTRLTQILVNLLSNAAKYNRSQGRVDLSWSVSQGRVAVRVADTGRGMTPEQQARLFEPFNRLGLEDSAVEGSGIGLVITKHLVERMNGRLELSSTPGVGSVFTVHLPTAEPAAVAQIAPPRGRPEPGLAARASGSVLYIEDNEINAQLMRSIFRQRPSLSLLVCATGAAGLQAAQAQPPQLILLDLHLPDMEGEALLAALRALDALSAVPVVIVSADATRARRTGMMARGAQAYLTKPLDVGETLNLVDRFISAAQAPGTPGTPFSVSHPAPH